MTQNKKICAFFGHSQVEGDIAEQLRDAVREMIETQKIMQFWCGGYGAFDRMAAQIVCEMKKEYAEIELVLVLAYLPEREKTISERFDGSLFLEGLEQVPKRFAISRRNQMMAQQCDVAICYINHSFGGAYKPYHTAIRAGKKVINLGTWHE